MKRLGIASFTKQGRRVADTLAEALSEEYEISRYESGLKAWCGELFASGAAGIIFVGACGIAVRTIAPFLKSKTTDPAVAVIDEKGRFVISLLSGHIGGANRLAKCAADIIGATPVITTATDVNGKFAVDVFAKENNLIIGSMKAAKEISAAILRGEPVGVYCEGRVTGCVPPELTLLEKTNGTAPGNSFLPNLIQITLGAGIASGTAGDGEPQQDDWPEARFSTILRLRPRACILGIGCRRGKSKDDIAEQVGMGLRNSGISLAEVAAVASIDLKKDEQGLLDFCRENGFQLDTYSAEELNAVQGDFSPSPFVKQKTGVDNVCERAALCKAGQGARLILRKQAANGVTVAVAVRDWSVHFEK